MNKAVFDRASDVIKRLLSRDPDVKPVSLVTPADSNEDLSALIHALNEGINASYKLDDALEVIRYYGRDSTYSHFPEYTPIADDRGSKARGFLDRMLD